MGVELGSAHGKIIIDSSGVTRGVKDSQQGLQGLQKSFKQASLTIGLAMGAATGAVIALKKVLEFGEQGAAVLQTAASFDTLLKSIGAAPDLLERLRAASGGTIDDMNLMSSTATLLAGTSRELGLELANNAPRIMEIAKAANKLNPSLGSTQFLYDSLMKGIKRGSPMVIDNTGLTLKLGEAYQALADKLGKNADELSSEEQKLAILNATMEAGGRMIEQVGGEVDSLTDSYARLGAVWKNAWDRTKADASGPISLLAGKLANLVEISERLKDTTEEQNAGWTKAHPLLSSLYSIYTVITEAQDYYIEKAEELKWKQSELGRIVANSKEPWQEMTAAVEAASEEANNTKSAFDELKLFVAGPLGKEIDNFVEKQGELRDRQKEIVERIHELNKKSYLTNAQKEELEELKREFEEVRQDIHDNAAAHEEATRRILYDLLQQKLAVDGVIDDQDLDLLTQVASHWGLIDDATYQAWTEMDKYVEEMGEGEDAGKRLADQIARIPASKTITLTIEEQRIISEATYLNERQGSGRQRALGGAGFRGEIYTVGEHGRELFMAPANGSFLPHHAANEFLREAAYVEQGEMRELIDTLRQLAQQRPAAINITGNVRDERDIERIAYRAAVIAQMRLEGRY